MKIALMSTPDTREEFEHRFHLLGERFNNGKLQVMRGIDTGLELNRFLPNGRIDLLSINETARVTANTTATFAGRFSGLRPVALGGY
ncbi:AVAST type 1 anti-phage system protein Avs1c [Massilia sp. TWP1-3-3]|uniref:AVAST type 1 anti-phage system protein Avs1c n=1 Tax=Massilia sp. TWP1-3-3 TaxID=2804573 RepID=UPI003CFA9D5D